MEVRVQIILKGQKLRNGTLNGNARTTPMNLRRIFGGLKFSLSSRTTVSKISRRRRTTRRPERAQDGRKQLRLRPRPQPPGQDHQGREEGGLLPEDATPPAELGAAPRVASLPAGHFVVP
jgi:hypothetical protein